VRGHPRSRRGAPRGGHRRRPVRLVGRDRLAQGLQSPTWRNRATKEQKRKGWEAAMRIEKILCTVLHEAHRRQVEEAMDTLSEGPEGFYG